MMAAMAAAMMGRNTMLPDERSRFHDDGKPVKKVLPKGVKEFHIGGRVYQAINEKTDKS